ncbi:MAG TPA: pseudaminic acid synthase [Aquifex aeolicus]|uniref:Pseudaminic acid synthase n=1 Tax=Aquifex aeolicus TaxID=63363 RepID=A0A9D0YPL9_AQUAO|nr:pseudaminic acid synthase [Aquificales bacterium]HIP86605.1 pseudaminic acid synthase [Aquifex sp.]HIP98222.1 pseudaminic acid synthase [Aquifex aeolicus]HIQ26641.1 pseudaminic acid synthase [Aquifex aeolicus]
MGVKIGNFDLEKDILIVAELSANHKQSLELAKETIYAMKEAGADAVKLQTYTPDTITAPFDNEYFKIKGGTLWDGKTLYELYREAYTPWEWHYELKELAEKLGLIFFSTPFDKSAVDFLEDLDIPAYKIASFEITDIPLIEYVASKGKPVIISTGIATLADIEEAINACKRVGNEQIILLKCTSAYPTPLEEANVSVIPKLKELFGVPVGLSDHTEGITVPVVATTLGAVLIEKHFILSKKIDSPDKEFSLTPEEFKEMVIAVRSAKKALGDGVYKLSEEMKKGRVFGRSLFVVKDVKKGELFTPENVRSIRPGYGLHPKYYNQIVGKKRARKDIKAGTPLTWDLID